MLLRHVVANNATADCSDDRVVSGVVARYAADHRALQTASSVCRSGCDECQRDSRRQHLDLVIFHGMTVFVGLGWIYGLSASR